MIPIAVTQSTICFRRQRSASQAANDLPRRGRAALPGLRQADHRAHTGVTRGSLRGRPRLCGAVLLALLLQVGCAPSTDEDARLAGIGTARAVPEPPPLPRFTEAGFIAADGQVLPLRKWLPTGDRGREVKAVILALHGFNDYSNAFDGA